MLGLFYCTKEERMKKKFTLIGSDGEKHGVEATKSGSEWKALCPFHEDTIPSLSINEEKGVYHCHGCGKSGKIENSEVMEADEPGEVVVRNPIIEKTYDYRDEEGNLLYQTVRYRPKDFKFRRPDGSGGWIYNLHGIRRVLYRLPELINADKSKPVLVVEGEKDVDNLTELGFVGTSASMGAGKWREEYNEYFRDRDVVLIPDNDKQGRMHCKIIGNSLKSITQSMKWLELPNLEKKEDISDWFEKGGTKEKLLRLIESADEYESLPTRNEFNAKDYSDFLTCKYKIECDRFGRLWMFDDIKGIYIVDAEKDIRSILRKEVLDLSYQKRYFVNEVIEDLKDRTFKRNNFLEPKPNLVPFNNKIYNLENNELIDFSPKHYFINKLPLDIDIDNEECPFIDGIFNQFVGDNNKHILYELSAYCLLRDYPYQKIFFVYGEGGNGKSTFINILTNLLGFENVSSINLNDLINNRFATSQLYGKLINICGEVDMNLLRKTGILKQLTGGDRIKSEKKFKEPFYFKNYAKIIVVTNKVPETTDRTEAFYRRVNLINFPNKFEGESDDKTILNKISRAEYEGYAWKCVQHLKLLKEKGFIMSNDISTLESMQVYDSLSSPLAEFLRLNTIDCTNGRIASEDLSAQFTFYLAAKNIPYWSTIRLSREMRSRGYELRTVGVEENGSHTTKQFWFGLSWR